MGATQGSKDPNNRVLGPKYYDINGIWALKPSYLGPWTVWVSEKSVKAQVPNYSTRAQDLRVKV